MSLSLAFIGAGSVSDAHLTGLKGLTQHQGAEAFRLSAVADIRPEVALALAERAERELGYRPAVYADHREMLERERLDAAAALVPNHAHGSVARDCLEAGLHLLLPCPLAITVTEGRRVIEQARRRGRALVVTEPTVLGREARALIAALRDSFVGEPQMILDCLIGVRRDGGAAWRQAKEKAGGGSFFDAGVHRARFYQEAFGPVTDVFAMARTFEPVRPGNDRGDSEARVTTEDTATACLRFDSGALGHLLISAAGKGEGFETSRVYGGAGVVDLTNRTITRDGKRTEPLSDVLRPYRDESIPEDAFAHAFEQWQGQILSGKLSPGPGEAALEAMGVIFACLEAAQTGRLIDVADVLSGAACAYEDSIEVARLSNLDRKEAVKPVSG